jgi:hypothetical protein
VWPATLTQDVPLSAQINGGVSYNFPGSDAHDASGHAFNWDGIVDEFHLFAGGAFNDSLTYFAEATFSENKFEIEHGYLLWSDVVGPPHLVNLWGGRLAAPSLHSWGMHSSYVSDSLLPMTSISGLYNPTGEFAPGIGHADGIELNGILAHRFDYAVGWLSSRAATGLNAPNAQDFYGHVGAKFGGMSLDGEGPGGALVPDPMRPWRETSITIDAFAYRAVSILDNGSVTGTPIGQEDRVSALGGVARLLLGSLSVTAGAQYERHSSPYAATPTAGGGGTPELRSARAFTQYDELDYVIYPWLVPGVRFEYTTISRVDTDSAHVLRVIPAVAMLVRPNIKVAVDCDIEQAYGLPPVGNWSAAGAVIGPASPTEKRFGVQRIDANVAWAF